MVSSTNHAYNLTVNNSASGHYALVVMTVVAVLILPIVVLYQGWSFRVFHGRITAPPASSGPPIQPSGLTGTPGPSPAAAPEGGGAGLGSS